MAKNLHKISVIIPTVNAHEELNLAIESIKKNSDHDIEFLIVIDPDMNTGIINPDILKVCKLHRIKPIINKSNLGPYGNWNKGASASTTNWLVFATDDQYFAPHWDSNLLKYWKPKRLIAGRLIEPGIIPVWPSNIEKNFGVLPKEFKEEEFLKWIQNQTTTGFENEGFFVPMLQHKDDYTALGGYPTEGKFGTSTAVSNDVLYVQRAVKKGYKFGTASDSYSYHFQASSWKKKTLDPSIGVVVLTNNSSDHLAETLSSLSWASKIIIIDSGSTDNTLEIARKYKSKILKRKFDNFAAQRNWALQKLYNYDWVFMVDSDEVVEKKLALELMSFAKDIYLDGVRVPRKNYIFGKWIKHTDWYPDYRLVFFRPKIVTYNHGVHEIASFTKGNETTSNAKGNLIHHNYDSVEQFLIKNLITYPQVYAAHLNQEGIKSKPVNFIEKPIREFMRRFFLSEGYKDGMYGLVLSLLMATQEIVVCSYLWELQGKKSDLTKRETQEIITKTREQAGEVKYWFLSMTIDGASGLGKLALRVKRKVHKWRHNL